MRVHMFLPEEDLIPFLACLGLGTLRAIRAGALHPDVGIWTLAVPGFRIPLEERRNLPRELLEVFGAADELSAIKDLGGQARFEEVLDGQIRVLERILAASPESSWSLRWANEAEPPRGG